MVKSVEDVQGTRENLRKELKVLGTRVPYKYPISKSKNSDIKERYTADAKKTTFIGKTILKK